MLKRKASSHAGPTAGAEQGAGRQVHSQPRKGSHRSKSIIKIPSPRRFLEFISRQASSSRGSPGREPQNAAGNATVGHMTVHMRAIMEALAALAVLAPADPTEEVTQVNTPAWQCLPACGEVVGPMPVRPVVTDRS